MSLPTKANRTCHQCHLTFKTPSGLKRHLTISNEHREEYRHFKCAMSCVLPQFHPEDQ
ncbi:hypothetical protein K492DRAFT_173725 [Lichtheimia hyalospora FSU 10163]|nr:hypothetical protein K492DRAFT_173725 [Lichtheimia hyalospora FSU 10163]